jgi:nitrogenase-stabilizing/protective protein
MDNLELEEDLEELSSAEDFLDYFDIEYDRGVVHVNRLHILQRFHDYISAMEEDMNFVNDDKYSIYKDLLKAAYEDFVKSDALTEKVFKVFRMNEPQTVFISLDSITK